MSTPYDAWEAMYYLERSAREHQENQGVEGKTSLLSSLLPPSGAIASAAVDPQDEIRTSLRNSAAREEDLLIVEPFVTNEEVSFSSPIGGLETCLEPFAEISNYEEPISPTSMDGDDNEILKQRQVSLRFDLRPSSPPL
jgi:hypothetical protein